MTNRCRAAVGASLLVLAVAPTPISGRAPARQADALALLVRAQGVSGFEAGVRDVVKDLLPAAARTRVDEAGNLLLTIGQGRPHFLIAAAVDEDGYLVSRIMDDGYLRLQRVTTGVANRLFDQYHYGQPVLIRTKTRTFVPGVIGSASQHLQRGREQSTAIKGLDDLWVDIGAESGAEVARLGVQLLDTVALRDRVQILADGRVAGVAAQARAHALALVSLVHSLGRAPAASGSLTIAWAAQGSFGDRGFARLAQQVDADRVIVLSRAAVTKDASAGGTAGALGLGPLVPESDTRTIDAAKQAKIAVQAVPPALLRVPGAGRERARLAVPVQFMQMPVETVQESDQGPVCAAATVAGLPPDPAGASLPPSAVAAAHGAGAGTSSNPVL
jgi:endoglucanase